MIVEERTKPACPQCRKEIALSRSVVAKYPGDPQAGEGFWGKPMRVICKTNRWVHFEVNGEHRMARLKNTKIVIFPANGDTFLPLPAGQWRYLEDGRIEARLSTQDLRDMKMMRDAVTGVDVRRDVVSPVDHNETPLDNLPALDEYLDDLFGEDDSDLDGIFNKIIASV